MPDEIVLPVDEVEPVVTPEPTPETPELDETVSERTQKNFDRIREQAAIDKAERDQEIARLKAENAQLKAPKIPNFEVPELDLTPATFTPEQYPNLTNTQIDAMVDKVITADGYVNENELKKQLRDANSQAREAVKAAQAAMAEAKQTKADVERQEQERQQRRAFKRYPSLNPTKADFDSDFYNLVRNEMVAQRATNGEQNLMKACAKISEIYKPKMTPKQETEKAKEVINSTTTGGKRYVGSTTSNKQDIQNRMRSGSLRDQRGALAERLASLEKKS